MINSQISTMIPFPIMTEKQVAILKADGKTGHILTIDDKIYHSDNKNEVYIVCEDLNSATKYIAENQFQNEEIECSVFNNKQELIEFFKAVKWREE